MVRLAVRSKVINRQVTETLNAIPVVAGHKSGMDGTCLDQRSAWKS